MRRMVLLGVAPYQRYASTLSEWCFSQSVRRYSLDKAWLGFCCDRPDGLSRLGDGAEGICFTRAEGRLGRFVCAGPVGGAIESSDRVADCLVRCGLIPCILVVATETVFSDGKEMMDCSVFWGAFMNDQSQSESTSAVYWDPIVSLKYEHQMALQRLEAIERTLQYLETLPKGMVPEKRKVEQSRLREGVLSLEQGMDLHFHKEEDALFPVLAKYIGKEHGPIEVMLDEHEQLRLILSDWKKCVCELCKRSGPEREPVLRTVTTAGYEAIRLLRLHIKKENQILFEICEASLSPEEKRAVARKIKTLGVG